jgi:hypothetical protein
MTPRRAYLLIIAALVAPQLPIVITVVLVAFALTGWLMTFDENTRGDYAEMRDLKRAQKLTGSNVTMLRSAR